MASEEERREAARQRRRGLIERLNRSEERLRELERERNLSRRGFGQVGL